MCRHDAVEGHEHCAEHIAIVACVHLRDAAHRVPKHLLADAQALEVERIVNETIEILGGLPEQDFVRAALDLPEPA